MKTQHWDSESFCPSQTQQSCMHASSHTKYVTSAASSFRNIINAACIPAGRTQGGTGPPISPGLPSPQFGLSPPQQVQPRHSPSQPQLLQPLQMQPLPSSSQPTARQLPFSLYADQPGQLSQGQAGHSVQLQQQAMQMQQPMQMGQAMQMQQLDQMQQQPLQMQQPMQMQQLDQMRQQPMQMQQPINMQQQPFPQQQASPLMTFTVRPPHPGTGNSPMQQQLRQQQQQASTSTLCPSISSVPLLAQAIQQRSHTCACTLPYTQICMHTAHTHIYTHTFTRCIPQRFLSSSSPIQ